MLKTHLFYIVLIVGGVISFRVWLQEHDARVKADETVKQEELIVKQQETAVAYLQTQIAATQTQAAQKVQAVQQVVKKATTPQEVVKTLPTLTDLPLAPRPVSDSPTAVEVEAQPLIELAGELKTAEVKLDACQQVSDLQVKQLAAKDAVIEAKDTEVKALKKKPRLFKRLLNVGKAVGVGVGIGLLISTHHL